MEAKDIMTKDLETISQDASLHEVARLIKEKRISGVPIVDEEKNLLGIITLTDLLNIINVLSKKMDMNQEDHINHLRNLFKEKKVKEFMVKKVESLKEDSNLTDIMNLMFNKKIHTIPILKDNKLVGVLGKHDLEQVFF
jgi:CBS domain-containing protein